MYLCTDISLLLGLTLLTVFGLFVLFSADYKSFFRLKKQILHLIIAIIVFYCCARTPLEWYRFITPWLFSISLILLTIVLTSGITGKGAQRWLSVWIFRFQPSEIFKLVVPMMLAWYLHEKELPPKPIELMTLILLTLFPAFLIAKQPDLGTAILTVNSGITVLVLSGLRKKFVLIMMILIVCLAPFGWQQLYPYQKNRILTFLHPEKDALGAGYHIIQSKTAIGSGGILGKGWLHGTQSQTKFLPEQTTDFIFSVCSEEFGLLGSGFLILLYSFVTLRCLSISISSQHTFDRLLGGTLSFNFFTNAFINIGMVTGLLPVVGIPLPLVSYGGTALICWFASFGVISSIYNHSVSYV